MKKIWLYIVCGVIALAVMILAIYNAFGGGSPVKETTIVNVAVPDGVAVPVSDSKAEAYRNSRVSTDEYFARLSAEEDISLVSSDKIENKVKPASVSEDESAAARRVFGDSEVASANRDVERSPVKPVMTGGSGYVQMTQEQKLEYDRRRAEVVRNVMTDMSQVTQQTEKDRNDTVRMLDLSSVIVSDSDIITSLDEDVEDPAVRYSSSAKVPFRCMFVRDQKVVDGQRVTIRLLEDYVSDGVRVPANTHLAAICKVADRLELNVRSIDMNGRIVPLQLVAYDTDGMAGIYCPETAASRNSRRASADAISAAKSTFGGLVGDLANTVLRTGATIARSASGELSVKVVSGYEFYLVKVERK